MSDDLIGGRLELLAAKIADEALRDEVGLAERLDAFKLLTVYFVNTAKINARPAPEDDEGTADFGSFKQRIAAASGR
jgi:hypothetical protein